MNIELNKRVAHGFSIIEIMVAMAIALMGVLVIFQVFAVSEGFRRTTTGGSDAQQNGAIAMYQMEGEIRQAGWGFNSSLALNCDVLAYVKTLGPLPAFTLVPVRITAGSATASDVIEVNYGSQNQLASPTGIAGNQASTTDWYQVKNRYGFAQGDVLLVTEPGKSCTIAQVTTLPTGTDSDKMSHDAGNSISVYNHPSGSGVSYTTNGSIFNLGSRPSHNVYQVTSNSLTVTTQFTSNTAQSVADNIVQLKAQYGKDNGINNATVAIPSYVADDGIVDSFDSTTPTTAAEWSRVLAIRIGIVARSATPEKPSTVGGACDATAAAPTWNGGSFNLTANSTWQCYRYKVFQTTIPLRNMLWKQS